MNSTGQMVDPFTGDFSYSIPLMNVDGYPITIGYNSNVTMFEEASWVGLGWDLNVGSISREMRGIPDDFEGDNVTKTVSQNTYATSDGKKNGFRSAVGYGGQGWGADIGVSVIYGKYMNSYNGKGTTWDFGINSGFNIGGQFSFGWGVGFSSDSQNGIGRDNFIDFGFSSKDQSKSVDLTLSQDFSSRAGLKSTNITLTPPAISTKYSSFSTYFSSTYSLGTMTSVPKLEYPRIGSNTNTTFEIGGIFEAGISMTAGYIHTSYSLEDKLDLIANTVNSAAYGYFHLGKGQNIGSSAMPMLDFNRERTTEFSENMVNLPFSAPTFDLYNVNAMGLSSSFRGQRNDIGTFGDPSIVSHNIGDNKLWDVHVGVGSGYIIVEGSGSDGTTKSEGTSGKWSVTGPGLPGWSSLEKDGIEEGIFFKSIGETTPRDMNQLASVNGIAPSCLDVTSTGDDVQLTNNFIGGGALPTTNQNGSQAVRATYYKLNTAQNYISKEPNIDYYDKNFPMTTPIHLDRNGDYRRGNHISAIEVTSVDGLNYFFETPVYSIKQSDVAFNACGLSTFPTYPSDGMVTYAPGTDNSTGNTRGQNHYFEKTTIPAYATSHLLTKMTSSDYIDRTGDGLTDDDMGQYYKFNYTQIYGQDTPYKWRFPYEANSAKLTQGLKATPFDDIASYSYGEKEIWYTKSIETKNYIVEFHLNDDSNPRHDGHGVVGEDGGRDDNMRLRKLEEIVLYSKNDRLTNGVNAVPLQVVSFEYGYTLCVGDPSNINSTEGKLTLNSIHFSGGDSQSGKLAPYEFEYGTGASGNPDFSYIDVDRWGGYKPNNTTHNNMDYSYPEQDEALANQYAQAWKLYRITNPTGGVTTVTYEADRFAYTQDKKVMKMYQIIGMSDILGLAINKTSSSAPICHNYMRNPSIVSVPQNVLYFELDDPVSSVQELKEKYFTDGANQQLNELFFKVSVDINPSSSNDNENVMGFAETVAKDGNTPFGLLGTAPPYNYGYIILSTVPVKDKDNGTASDYEVNPIQKTAWQFARLHDPERVYANCDFSSTYDPLSACDWSANVDAAVAFGADLDKQLNKKEFCQQFDASHSYIRLFDSRGYKFGGNARVKSITYEDKWNTIGSEDEASYTWNYTYDTRDGTSGVAAYEPALGSEVNPFYKWSAYTNEIKQFPDETQFNVEPVGELMFPAPVVGYAEMSVEFQGGQSTTNFYTAKDFPTIVKRTVIDKEVAKVHKLIKGIDTKLVGLSQGYSVITNDFHGKVRSNKVIDENQNQVQQSVYHYKGLDDLVKTIDRKGQVLDETVATEYDVYADARFVKFTSDYTTIGGGVDLRFCLPIFIPIIPTPVITYHKSKSEKGFFAHTFNKLLNESAIVESIETTYLGSHNTAQNMMYDRFSGEVILSSLNDEYDDPLYSLNYPAHWYYSNFENKYTNDYFNLTSVPINSGLLDYSTAYPSQVPLIPGDVVSVTGGSLTPNTLGWALDGGTGGNIIGANGTSINGTSSGTTYNVTLQETGRKNRLTENMMSVSTKTNPLSGSTFTFPHSNIYSVSAVDYEENHNVPCFVQEGREDKPVSGSGEIAAGTIINPFLYGVMGNFRITKQEAFQQERDAPSAYPVRKDGDITDYVPFYGLNTGKWYKINQAGHPDNITPGDYQHWRELKRINVFDRFGKPEEVREDIDVHNALLFGFNKYNNIIPIAQSTNAKNTQLAFDGFEDYDYLPTTPVLATYTHFDFSEGMASAGAVVTKEQRHSGLSSLKIPSGESVPVSRKLSHTETCEACESTADTITRIHGNIYQASTCDCLTPFAPEEGDYLVSVWVKQPDNNSSNCSDIKIQIDLFDGGSGSQTTNFTPSGPLIEGWQKIEGTFNIPSGWGVSGTITVSLQNNSNDFTSYFDDFRIHPLKSEMTTIVYDPNSLLPLATHDSYNYTTFYDYDENRALTRMKVETIEGIKTVSETSQGIKKTY